MKNTKTLLLTTIRAITVIAVSGCINKPQEKEVVVPNEQEKSDQAGTAGTDKVVKEESVVLDEKPAVSNDTEIDTSDWKTCQHEELGIKLKYPNEWKECTAVNSSFLFDINYNEYNITFTVNGSKNEKQHIKWFIEERGGFDYTVTKNGEVFQDVCSGGGCYGAIIEGNIYFFTMDIKSTQPVPEDFDGIWTPDHNITKDQIWTVLKNIELIE